MSNDFFTEIIERINKTLVEKQLGFIYDFKDIKGNGLILPFFARTMDSCMKNDMQFAITTDQETRAGILYNEKLIFISFGLFDRICKLSELIVSSGIIDNEKIEYRYSSLDFIDNPFNGFIGESTLYDKDQKNTLFLIIFETLFNFIIHHEIGHHYHKHGERQHNTSTDRLFDDMINHKKISKTEAIQSHARELIADKYSFWITISNVTNFLKKYNNINFTLMDTVKNSDKPAYLSIFLISCYFKMMDGNNLTFEDHITSTHPIAAFRAKYLYASFLESKKDESDDHRITFMIYTIMQNVATLFHEIDKFAECDFVSAISTNEMDSWFSKIYQEFPNWQRSQ